MGREQDNSGEPGKACKEQRGPGTGCCSLSLARNVLEAQCCSGRASADPATGACHRGSAGLGTGSWSEAVFLRGLCLVPNLGLFNISSKLCHSSHSVSCSKKLFVEAFLKPRSLLCGVSFVRMEHAARACKGFGSVAKSMGLMLGKFQLRFRDGNGGKGVE